MKEKLFRYRITHPERGSVLVIGQNKYEAVIAAARLWRVPWSSIARACVFEKLAEIEAGAAGA